MRLTNKKINYLDTALKVKDQGTYNESIYNKLCQLEDIEEELDIDLRVFGKVLQALDSECIYVKIKETKQYDGYSLDEETGEIRRCVIVRFSRYSNGLRDWFFTISWGDLSSAKHYLLKDYGKTWALMKEELEK